MNVIDIHAHAFPDSLAPRAMAKLTAMGDWAPYGDGTVAGLLTSMDAAGIDASVVCAIATKPGMAGGIVDWLASVASDRILPFASVHPQDEDAAGLVGRIADAGLSGVKLHPFYQDFAADDPEIVAICRAAADANLPVAMHCGADIAFENDPLPDRAGPARIAVLADACPNLRLLATHMGGWKMWDQVEQDLLGHGVWMDTSFCLPFSEPQRIREMAERHGLDRVCFGTDWPWNDQTADRRAVEALGWSADQQQKVFGEAARALLGR